MKIGIEIHQRLETTKLFCNCPSMLADKDDKPDMETVRRLHPVFSELGEIDEASRAEFSKDRLFRYQSFSGSDCLVEVDEEPPHAMNPEALSIALEIAAHLDANPVDELHVMRKMVIDGSNTAGFQRTAVVAMNGRLESSKGTVEIPLIAIEEESAGIVGTSGNEATYRLDRLGIPLVEINTAPVIRDGEHLKEVAEKLGMLLRATGKVARGLGTIRQDVNISTEGGARVEIKGAQDLRMLPTLVELEVKRQTSLVKIIHELRTEKAFDFSAKETDVTKIFSRTASIIIKKGLEGGASVMAVALPRHEGFLGREIQPGRRYGSELSDYAKHAGVKGIIHTDEDMKKYNITEKELSAVRKSLKSKEGDAIVLVVAPEKQASAALKQAVRRASMDFVPEETRKAHPDGTSSYMRPLPGRARMYPETDIPPIPITQELLAATRESMGESLEEKEKGLAKILNPEMAKKMIRSRHLRLFEELVEGGADPKLAAVTIEDTAVSLRREGFEIPQLEKTLKGLFGEYSKGTFVKAAIPDILKHMAKGASAESVVKVYRLQRLSGAELEKIAESEGHDMKAIMRKYRLQVDPAELAAVLSKKRRK
ncbi:MAG: Glu-tRNA(Gln) amidotransferase subunit GatE [Candidatus Micrarchaeota archaeon]